MLNTQTLSENIKIICTSSRNCLGESRIMQIMFLKHCLYAHSSKRKLRLRHVRQSKYNCY
jgi:hypothetical protein